MITGNSNRKEAVMRNIININENWKFIREDAGLPAEYPAQWSTVNLPHMTFLTQRSTLLGGAAGAAAAAGFA